MTRPVQPSAQSQATLQILRQAVAQELDKKRRLGHYAVVWQDGAPAFTKGGSDANAMEIPALQAEIAFLKDQLARLPESARLTRMSVMARINDIQGTLAQHEANEH